MYIYTTYSVFVYFNWKIQYCDMDLRNKVIFILTHHLLKMYHPIY